MAHLPMPFDLLVESGGKTRTATIEPLKIESPEAAGAQPAGAP